MVSSSLNVDRCCSLTAFVSYPIIAQIGEEEMQRKNP